MQNARELGRGPAGLPETVLVFDFNNIKYQFYPLPIQMAKGYVAVGHA